VNVGDLLNAITHPGTMTILEQEGDVDPEHIKQEIRHGFKSLESNNWGWGI